MTKARKVKASSKAEKAAPRKVTPPRKMAKSRKPAPKIHKYTCRRGEAKPEAPTAPRHAPKPADDAQDEAPPARAASKPAAQEPKAAPRGIAARLAAAAASAASDEDEPVIATKRPAPKGGVAWEDWEDDDDAKPAGKAAPPPSDPVLVAPKPQPAVAADGLEVVAKGASKFSAADIELLRAAIKVKGSAQVVEGINLDELKWDHEGLVPCIAQDRRTGAVVQLGHMNKETLSQSLRSKQMQYFDRARGKVVEKGESSGHPQRLVAMKVDCDKDALLALVDQEGPACHRDTGTCWTDGRSIPLAGYLGDLDRQLEQLHRKPVPDEPLSRLLQEPIEALKRFVEEANDATRNLQGKGGRNSLEHDAADVLHALLVACRAKGVGLEKVVTELYARHMAAQLKQE